MTFTHALGTNNYGSAKFIVDASAANGTHTTIATALTSASSGDTIFIRPGTYTENLTLKAGVNLTAFGSDSSLNGTGKVIISGTCTLTAAGSVTISGIQLQTNSAALLAVTGSAASVVNLENCYLNCTNNTGITFSTSSGNGLIKLFRCEGDLGTTGIAYFSHSSSGSLDILGCKFSNSGASTTANTCSAGTVSLLWTLITNPITMSSTGGIGIRYSSLDCNALNTTALTAGGSGIQGAQASNIFGGSASAITIAQTLTCVICEIGSSNTNAITGAGTLNYQDLVFTGSSSLVNTTTQVGLSGNYGPISFDGGTNKLSVYTEGTWTPTVVGGSTAGTTTYTAQNGYYTRIGNLVTIQFTVGYSAATGTGIITLGGLPFTIKNQTGGEPQGSCVITNATTWPVGTTNVSVNGIINTITAKFLCSGTAVGASSIAIANSAQTLVGTLTYLI